MGILASRYKICIIFSLYRNLDLHGHSCGAHWIFLGVYPRFTSPRGRRQESAKFHLRRIIGNQVLSFLELNSVLYCVEAVLNSRPLKPLSDDISDLSLLTPAYFLIMRNSFLVPVQNLSKDKVPLTAGKKLADRVSNGTALL